MHHLSIVVPFYNEEKRVALFRSGVKEFFQTQSKHFEKIELILVNDGSRDGTLNLLKELRDELLACSFSNFCGVCVVNSEKNCGKGGALKLGINAATFANVLTMDADLATPIGSLEKWLNDKLFDLENMDGLVLIASREHEDSSVQDKPFRRIIGRFFNFLVQFISGLNLKDSQCGYKFYPMGTAQQAFGDLKDLGWAHDIEVLLRLEHMGYRILECPVSWQAVDESKVRVWRDSIRMFKSLISIRVGLGLASFVNAFKKPVKNFVTLAYVLSLVSLFTIFTFIFRDYGITWDEPVQSHYGRLVVKFYESLFQNREALTFSNLYLYGGFFEAIPALLRQWIPGLPEYETRHFVCSMFGLFGLVGAYRLGKMLWGKVWGVIFFWGLALHPIYWGHSFLNSKDLPFAVLFLWSIYYILKAFKFMPLVPVGLMAKIGIFIGLACGIRVGGLLLLCYLIFSLGLSVLVKRSFNLGILVRSVGAALGVFVISYLTMLAFWPWAQDKPFINPWLAFKEAQNFKWLGDVLFEGQAYRSDQLPWYYIPKLLVLQTHEYFPVLFSLGLVSFILSSVRTRSVDYQIFLLIFFSLFPLAYIYKSRPVVYDSMRHFIFVVPLMMAVSVYAAATIYQSFPFKKITMVAVLAGLLFSGYRLIVIHPYQYLFFNQFVGGISGAYGRYELDYWAQSTKDLASKLMVEEEKIRERLGIAQGTPLKLYMCGHYSNFAEYYPKDRLSFISNPAEADIGGFITRHGCQNSLPGKEILAVQVGDVAISHLKILTH